MAIKKCPDCSSELEKGYIADFAYGGVKPQYYTKGEYHKKPTYLPFQTVGKLNEVRSVFACRCTNCDRIFEYAESETFNYQSRATRWGLWLFVSMLILLIFGLIVSQM